VTVLPRRIVLSYSGFGPYHTARWRAVCSDMGDRGWEVVPVEVLTAQDRYEWGTESGDDGIVRLRLPSDGRDQIRWRDAPRFLWLIAALRPDAVAVNGWALRDSLLLHVWCRIRRIARIVVTDTTRDDVPRTWLRESLKRRILAGVGAAFAAGSASRRYVVSLGVPAERITDGCDVVDNSHFASARSLRGFTRSNSVRLLTIARLIPEKNLLAASDAFFRIARERDDDIIWTIAGYGPLENDLRHWGEMTDGRIRLVGALSYDELPSVLAEADVFWLPSLSESWGLVVNEAMAAGLPVAVSERAGCHEDLVTPNTGWVIDPFSADTLEAGLRRVLDDRDHWIAMGDAAASLIADWDLDRFSRGLFAAAELALQPPRQHP
jgi:glycosyltransferase involved in cell wall biosynthesis